MAGSHGAAITVDAGRGDSDSFAPKEYRISLPPLPSGDAMKKAVVLHCDIAGRPYRIEDFRRPLEELGVIREVAGIGAYQMSHVWLLKLHTDVAKLKLVEAGRLEVKGRTCLVVYPTRQEVRVKLHWVSFDVSNEDIRKAFADYGKVKDVSFDRWKVAGFEGAESTTRIVRIVLREGVTLERLPHQLRFGSGTVLVVVPGRAPICLRCRKTGHIRRDCRAPRCSECRAYGHEQQDCVRSYARAAVRGAGDDQNDLLMDEEEAERAAAPTATSTEQPTPVDKGGRPDTGPKKASVVGAKQQETAASGPAVEDSSTSSVPEGDARDVAATDSEPTVSEMDLDKTAVKRRHEGGAELSQERRLRQLERKWKVAAGWKGADSPQRSSSPHSREKLSQ